MRYNSGTIQDRGSKNPHILTIITQEVSFMDFMDYLQMANSPVIWIACAIPVLLIAVQAIIFVRRSLTTAKRMGITDHQINSAV